MGGRNGGAMGRKRLNRKEREKKDNVVTMPRTDSGADVGEGGKGEEKDAAKKPGKEKAAEEDEKAKRKGGKKALRHAVNGAVKENKEEIANSLVTRTVGGDMRSAEIMVALMEKKKDGEDDDDWDGPGLADILVPSQLWRGKAAAKQTENDEEKDTEAA